MHDLPWLVVHGAFVWKAALVLFSCAGAALAVHLARREALHAAAEARRSLGKSRDRIDVADLEKPVTLAGKLDALGQLCSRFEDGAPAVAASAAVGEAGVHVRAAEIRLDVGGTIVVIEGPVEVLAGSREDHPKRPLTYLNRAIRERVLVAGGLPWVDRAIVLRSLKAGDQVIAHGLLRRSESTSKERGYRVSAGGFMLAPAPRRRGQVSPVSLAYGGPPRLAGPVRRLAVGLAFGGAAFFAVFCVGAEIAGVVASASDVDSSVRASIWAATPLRRTAALESLAAPLRLAPTLDAQGLSRLVALDLLLGRCAAAAADMSDRGRFARAADLAEECGDPAAAARAAFEGGDFARSSRDAAIAHGKQRSTLSDDTDTEGALCLARAHLLAGELGRAAVELRRAEGQVRMIAGDAITLGCVADALDARAGGAPARARLLAARRSNWTTECALAIADLFDGQERADIINRFSEDTLRKRGQTMFNVGSLLLAEVDAKGDDMPTKITTPSPDRVLAVQTGGVDYIVMGLAGSILDRLTADPSPNPAAQRLRAVLGASRAVFDASTAAWDESRRRAALAAGDVETLSPNDSELQSRIFGVLAAVPLRYPSPEPKPAFERRTAGFSAFEAMAAMIEHRDATKVGGADLASMKLEASAQRQLALALSGSSTSLAIALASDPPYGPALRLLRPEDAEEGRMALERWLLAGRARRSQKCDIKARLSDIGARLSLAQVLRSEMEGEITASLSAFRQGLLRRDANVALAIIDSFVVPSDSRP